MTDTGWVDVPPVKTTDGWVDVPTYANMTGLDLGKRALQNAPSDFANVVLGTAQQVANPVGTGLQFGKELATNPEFRGEVARHFTNYGSAAGIKENVGEHPIGTALDVATLITPLKRTPAAVAEAAAPKILSSAELKAAGGAGLDMAKGSGVFFKPDFVQPLRDTLVATAKQMNFRPGRPGSEELGHILKDVDSMSSRPWSFDDVHTLQQDLNDAWKVSKRAGRDQIAGVAGRLQGVVISFSTRSMLPMAKA
jgi:hypothetical protein